MSNSTFISAYARTPLGAMQGELASQSVCQLGGVAISAALNQFDRSLSSVDDVFMGCVLPAGSGQAPAKQAAQHAGLDASVNCCTINKVCGSGMKSIMLADQSLRCGDSSVVIAGGMESMSNAPYLLAKARSGYRLGHGQLLDHTFVDGLEDARSGELMGLFAEATADKYHFSREDQDNFALASLERAQQALSKGYFDQEIAPVDVNIKGGVKSVAQDELPKKARPEKIPMLRPAFKPDGSVTAANASALADGASALVLVSDSASKGTSIPVRARIVACAQHAQAPEWFTTAPSGAINKVLDKAGWSLTDVDLYEINEAFAVVALAAMKSLSLPHDIVNIQGGACALGHPLGASGARIVVTLLSAMERLDVKRGVASLCIGGGEATAVAIERIET